MEIERRYIPFETLSDNEGQNEKIVRGYAAVFNTKTVIGDFFEEQISRGAFARSLLENDIRACWNHNLDLPIGRTKNGSLRLHEDEHGLAFELDLPNTTTGNDAYELIRTGVVSGVSFGFSVRKESFEKGENMPLRTLKDIDLFEISPCTFPSYQQTNVVARSLKNALAEKEAQWAKDAHESELEEIRRKIERIEFEMRLDLFESI